MDGKEERRQDIAKQIRPERLGQDVWTALLLGHVALHVYFTQTNARQMLGPIVFRYVKGQAFLNSTLIRTRSALRLCTKMSYLACLIAA